MCSFLLLLPPIRKEDDSVGTCVLRARRDAHATNTRRTHQRGSGAESQPQPTGRESASAARTEGHIDGESASAARSEAQRRNAEAARAHCAHVEMPTQPAQCARTNAGRGGESATADRAGERERRTHRGAHRRGQRRHVRSASTSRCPHATSTMRNNGGEGRRISSQLTHRFALKPGSHCTSTIAVNT